MLFTQPTHAIEQSTVFQPYGGPKNITEDEAMNLALSFLAAKEKRELFTYSLISNELLPQSMVVLLPPLRELRM